MDEGEERGEKTQIKFSSLLLLFRFFETDEDGNVCPILSFLFLPPPAPPATRDKRSAMRRKRRRRRGRRRRTRRRRRRRTRRRKGMKPSV